MTFMNPKHWGVLLCSLLMMGSVSAQSVEYPFNPDSNGDNLIYTPDLLDVLAVYETEFDPDPITVDGITLEEYLIQLNEAIEAVEAGTAGADGADGADGQDGIGIASITDNGDGTLTIALTDGTAVITADLTGPAGADGADGANGADGAPGAPGVDGQDGNGIAFVTENGDGTFTLVFTDGTAFTTADFTGAAGADGADGADGAPGAPGANGTNGEDGHDGTDGVGIALITHNEDGTLTIELTDGTTVTTEDLTGPAGADGANGTNGSNGAPGADGADGADGANGVGISTIGLNGSGALGVQLTDGTLLNLGCILDEDADGICDQVDACTDTEAANYNVGNVACEYNKWYIPFVLGAGPAILATSTPFGYLEAHFDCVQSVVDGDSYCIDAVWDGLCESDYLNCVNSPEVHLERLDYAVGDIGPAGGIIVYVDTFDVHIGFDYLEAASHDFVGVTAFGMSTDAFDLECNSDAILLMDSNSMSDAKQVGEGEVLADESEDDAAFAIGAGGGGDASLPEGYRVRNAGGKAIGTGLINTLELARYNTCAQSTAKQVLAFQQNGYRDFHIPSLWELKVMAQALYDLPTEEIVLVGGGGGGGDGGDGGVITHSVLAGYYWSSSEFDATRGQGALIMNFGALVFSHGTAEFSSLNKIRPVRAF